MSPLLYFMEGGATAPAHAVRPNGDLCAVKHNTDGPEGLTGTLATPCDVLEDLTLEGVRWIEQPSAVGRFFIGVRLDVPPLPKLFQRSEIRMGHPVTLKGQVWQIPVVRLVLGGTGLPKRRILNPDGSRGWEVEGRYKTLCDLAAMAWDWRNAAGTMTYDQIDELCGLALSINYRLGMQEATAMDLLGDAEMVAIVDALLDVPELMRMLEAHAKKNEQPGL